MTRRFGTAIAFAFVSIAVSIAALRSDVSAQPAAVVMFDGTAQVITTPLVYRGGVGQETDCKNTRLIYRGPPTLSVIRFEGCTRASLKNLEIVIDAPGVVYGVLITNAVNPGQTGWSTACEIKNVRVMHGGSPHAARRAFGVDSTAAGGADANNDHHHFTDCLAQSYSEVGFYFNGTQCHDIHGIRNAALDYGGRRPIGLHSKSGVFICWERGAFNSNSIDIKLDSPETQAVFTGVNSENSTQFLVARHNGECFTRITDVRWEGKPGTDPIIVASGPGPWHISNSFFSGLNGTAPRFEFNGSTVHPSELDLRGVMLRQHGGVQPYGPLVTAPRGWEIRQHGLTWQRIDTGTAKKMIYVNKPIP